MNALSPITTVSAIAMRGPLRPSVPTWTQSLNLAGPRLPTASWAWVLLLAGLTALAWVLPPVLQADADLAQAQTDVQRLKRARHQLEVQAQAQARATRAPDMPGNAGATTAHTKGDPTGLLNESNAAHAAQLMQWLAFPWVATLQQADVAAQAERALLLGFNLELSNLGAGPQAQAWARMSAAVTDDAAALRWAQALGPQAQLMSRDKLGTPVDTARGPYAWRAEVSWPGAQP
jgi:hypothetical protein